MKTVAIRELRQNPAEAIRSARDGEVVLVTDRNRPVAQLIPVAESRLEQMIRAGIATPATQSLADLPEPHPSLRPGHPTASETLIAMREAERY
ncbi:MAG: type II toxin-antitoxin system prevent-host-death family antitoxin [Micrococcales bacterium]|nr:type II toxin-antitoxin system prevent-host-death family antitoxin [Micrococcales bacterium]